MSDSDATPLLEPIPGENPVGSDLRESDDPNNEFRQIRDARGEARRLEQDADLVGEPDPAAYRLWVEVRDKATEYIASQAKDLEIAAYLIESLIRIDRFSGLAEGAKILQGLVENYWGELYPRPDLEYDEGNEATLLPIARLDLEYAIRRIPVTDDTSIGELLMWQHAQAMLLDTYDAEEREKRIAQGAISSELFDRASAETSPEFFLDLKSQIEGAETAVRELESKLDEIAGSDSPNLSKAFEAISDASSVLRQVAGSKLDIPEELPPEDDGEEATGDGSSGGSGQATGAIRNRDDAFRELEKIALWFEKTEPQSILPAEIRKAVRRGRMSPEELYADLIDDETVRDQLYRDVGIKNRSSDSDEDNYD